VLNKKIKKNVELESAQNH